MNKALWKDNLRTIRKTLPRFLSIFAIIALGVAFFIGIRAAGPSMVKTARVIYQEGNLPDGQVVSTAGMSEQDINLLQQADGIRWLPMKTVETTMKPSDEQIKLFTYNGDSQTSFFKVVEGHMPTAPNEIALDTRVLESVNTDLDEPIKLGDTVTMADGEQGANSLKASELKVVGFVQTSLYIERTSRTQTANIFGVVTDSAVDGDIYTEAYYWVESLAQAQAYDRHYVEAMDKIVAQIETLIEDRPALRLIELQEEIKEAINEGQAEIDSAYEELADNEAKLNDALEEIQLGRKDYDEGLMALREGQITLNQGMIEYQQAVKDYDQGRLTLADGQEQLAYNREIYQAGLADYQAGLDTLNQQVVSGEAQLNQSQEELDAGLKAAQTNYEQLAQGQATIDAGYQSLTQGRQQLLDQLNQATKDATTGEQLLTTIQSQIEEIDSFLVILNEANNDAYSEQLTNWMTSLQGERDLLVENLSDLSQLIAQLPIDGTEEQTVGDLNLSQAQLDQYTQLLGYSVTPAMKVSDLTKGLNDQINGNSLLEILATKVAEVKEAQDTVSRLEQELATLQIERQNLSDRNKLEEQRQTYIVQQAQQQAELDSVTSRQGEISQLLNDSTLVEESRQALMSEQAANQASIDELTAGLESVESQLLDLDQAVTEMDALDQLIEAKKVELNQASLNDEAKQAELNALLRANGLEEVPTNINVPELRDQMSQLTQAVKQLELGQAELDAQNLNLQASWQTYYDGIAQIEQGQAAIAAGWTELNAQRQNGLEQLSAAQSQLEEGRIALEQGQVELDQGWSSLEEGRLSLNQGYQDLINGQNNLTEGRQTSLKGRLQLMDAMVEYQKGKREFDEAYPDAMIELKEAEADLDKARKNLADLREPTYLVQDRADNTAYQGLFNNAEQLGVIANIFPVFFFAIAILVVFTTIKRMASEQRNYMGTMKQMGYSNHTILAKYVIYAGTAALLGVIAGLIIGYAVFPSVIINAYNMLYYFNNPQIEILWSWNIIAAGIAILTALIPAIWTPLQMLRTQPAYLLVPESPKAGKKLLLERLPAVWNLFSFNAKMTVRNLLRYKGRNLMTLIGVAGCTMLIVTGFGISNTIAGIVDEQFNQIQTYDGIVYLQDSITDDQLANVANVLGEDTNIEATMPIQQASYSVKLPDGQTQDISVIVPLGDTASFDDYVHLRQRHQASDSLSIEEGPFVTERMAELLNLSQVGSFTVEDEDYRQYDITNATVVENYTMHYLYMTSELYQATFNQPVETTAYLLHYKDGISQKKIEERLANLEGVLTTANLNKMSEAFASQMGSLDLITLVLIISAAALAFVVLYNLTNINVAERIRELSTIKVLGFYDREVSQYIFNEVLVLTLLGGLVGLGLGTVMNHFLLKTMQMMDVLFYPTIEPCSYILSLIISFIFSSIVMLAMHQKLKKIDMVEALKGVD